MRFDGSDGLSAKMRSVLRKCPARALELGLEAVLKPFDEPQGQSK